MLTIKPHNNQIEFPINPGWHAAGCPLVGKTKRAWRVFLPVSLQDWVLLASPEKGGLLDQLTCISFRNLGFFYGSN
jgi:hypothetical protein